jgi:hypothetical protein
MSELLDKMAPSHRVDTPEMRFLRALDEATGRFEGYYRAEHANDDPAVVNAYCDGLREGISMAMSVVMMQFRGR